MCAQWRLERRTLRVTAMGRMYEELPMGRKIMLSSSSGVWRPPMEIQYGPFEVAVAIPAPFDSDAVTSKYRDGFLEVVVPKVRRAKNVAARTKTK